MTREDAERLLVLADRLWTIGGGPEARRGSARRIARALEEYEGDVGFDHEQLALGGGEPAPTPAGILEGERRRRRSRRGGQDTSRAAAESVQDLRANQAAVLEALEALGGEATDERLVAHYQAALVPAWGSLKQPRWPKQSESGIRTRRHELTEEGFIEDSGERQALSTGRQAIVWRRTQKDRRSA